MSVRVHLEAAVTEPRVEVKRSDEAGLPPTRQELLIRGLGGLAQNAVQTEHQQGALTSPSSLLFRAGEELPMDLNGLVGSNEFRSMSVSVLVSPGREQGMSGRPAADTQSSRSPGWI